ncbi:MAG TPA: YihY/virulence factor BrkB family protein [Polyangiaceae bacterium]|nr:YihY/virulence factor BrkB family protein [Polyangiaceae bacterium]
MLRNVWTVAKETVSDWLSDDAPRLAASLAFYTLLSLAPIIVIAVSIAGLAFGPEAARGQIAGELGAIVGTDAAKGVETVVASAKSPGSGTLATAVGIVTLFVGASGVFGELQFALNRIWEVKAREGRGIWGEIKDRFFSFTMVLGVAFLLLVSLVLSAVLSAIGKGFTGLLPGGEAVWQLVNFAFSLAMVTGLFALIYKVVPDAEIHWADVWPGALVTALLFTIGKSLLGLYLGKASVGSSYGAAGSIVVLVIWVYYSAQILFLGAEFTQVYTRRRGGEIKPTGKGERLNEGAQPPAESVARHA